MAMATCGKDVNLNNFVYRYLVEPGVSEEATQEFVRKAKKANSLQGFDTFGDWRKITEPQQILQNLEGMGPFEVVDSTDSASVNGPANKISDFSTRNRTGLQLFYLNLLPDDQDEQPNWKEIKQVANVEDEEICAEKRKRDEALENDPIDLVKKKKHAAEKGKKTEE